MQPESPIELLWTRLYEAGGLIEGCSVYNRVGVHSQEAARAIESVSATRTVLTRRQLSVLTTGSGGVSLASPATSDVSTPAATTTQRSSHVPDDRRDHDGKPVVNQLDVRLPAACPDGVANLANSDGEAIRAAISGASPLPSGGISAVQAPSSSIALHGELRTEARSRIDGGRSDNDDRYVERYGSTPHRACPRKCTTDLWRLFVHPAGACVTAAVPLVRRYLTFITICLSVPRGARCGS